MAKINRLLEHKAGILGSVFKITCLSVLLWMGSVKADIPIEKVTTLPSLPAAHPYRLYFTDLALPHIVDGRVFIIDGNTLKLDGMVYTGMFALSTLSPDRSEIYVASTYYTKVNRGERKEEILVYDAHTLKLKAEIPYPARHTPALPYLHLMRTSADGKFIYVMNATPATSISIVARATGEHIAEVAVPGCYGVYPAKSSLRFSTLCGDGTLLTISLDGEGKPVNKKKNTPFFDSDQDALFIAAAQDGDVYHFVSFKGNIVSVDVSDQTARSAPPWSLVNHKAREKWRPSGYQPIALHLDTDTLYVAMHPEGKEGSHKDPAKEVWVYDLKSHQRVARLKVEDTTGLAVSQGVKPRLFVFDTGRAMITAYDGVRQLKKVVSGNFGESPTQLQTQ